MAEPHLEPVPVWIAVSQWAGSLLATLGLGYLTIRSKGMKAFKRDLEAHIEEDEKQFTRLSGQVHSIDHKLTRVVVMQEQQSLQATETRAAVEKIRDHLLGGRRYESK